MDKSAAKGPAATKVAFTGHGAGAASIRTRYDSENAPMLAINRKLGYQQEPGLRIYVWTACYGVGAESAPPCEM